MWSWSLDANGVLGAGVRTLFVPRTVKAAGYKAARLVALSFLLLIFAGALVLMLPISSATGEPTGFIHALFTATSAVLLTGVVMVDAATHWSLLGQVVIVLLIQVGGFGIMSLTSLAGLFISRKVSLRSRRRGAAPFTRSLPSITPGSA